MAAFETSAQFERDLRSGHKEWKRGKDSHTKWSYGSQPSSGCRLDWVTLQPTGGSEEQREKSRPRRKWSETSHQLPKAGHNITKTTRGNGSMPSARVRSACSAQEELRDGAAMSRSVMDLLHRPPRAASSGSDGVLYSFDRTDSPGRPLTLDVFVRPNPRATERLVEREYEVLDTNGDALKGRRARRTLRQGGGAGGAGAADSVPATAGARKREVVEEDEGFELV